MVNTPRLRQFWIDTMIAETMIRQAEELSLSTEVCEIGASAGPSARRGKTAMKGELFLPLTQQFVTYGSAIERDFLLKCRLDHEICSVTAQPLSITFLDSIGQTRSYTPDYLVEKKFGEGSSWYSVASELSKLSLVEVKRREDFKRFKAGDLERLAAGFAVGNNTEYDFCVDFGLDDGSRLSALVARYAHLANEKEDEACTAFKKCLSADLEISVQDALAWLKPIAASEAHAMTALYVGLAKGWAETKSVDFLEPSDILYFNSEARSK